MNNPMNNQIGGNHYKDLPMQPVDFAVKAELNFIQGSIVKYVSRFRKKNGKQDIDKAIHFAQLAIELNCQKDNYIPVLGLAYTYCKLNGFTQKQTDIIVATVKEDYRSVARNCVQLIKQEYPLT